MNKFVDREKERVFLEGEYNRKGSSLVILYGRRRTGKTALVAEFIKNKEAIYFLATQENETQNKNSFKNLVAEYTQNKLLMNAIVDRWELLFESLIEYKTSEKKVIVIDEFQYIGKSNPAFPSIFQKIWDTLLIKENIMIILCGSLISMMESQTLNYDSPLYGRRTGQIKLKQIPFRYYNEFLPSKSYKELIECFSITGGIPKYIELFYESDNIYNAIEQNVISKSSFLYDEPNFLLQKEVNEVGSYFSLIKTIAAGNRKLSKIASAIEVKQTSLTKYLKTLIDLDIIEREFPITEKNPEKSKKGKYKIKDNFILFWFRFIYPNLNYIESGNEELAIKKIKTNLIDNHISYIYEDICIEKMWQLNKENIWNFNFEKVGKWWNNNLEIDIVAINNESKDIIFGECKYWNDKIGISVLKELEEKSKNVIWNNETRNNYYVLFSINGFTDELIAISKTRNDLILNS